MVSHFALVLLSKHYEILLSIFELDASGTLAAGSAMGRILCWFGEFDDYDESLVLPEFEVRHLGPPKGTQ